MEWIILPALVIFFVMDTIMLRRHRKELERLNAMVDDLLRTKLQRENARLQKERDSLQRLVDKPEDVDLALQFDRVVGERDDLRAKLAKLEEENKRLRNTLDRWKETASKRWPGDD